MIIDTEFDVGQQVCYLDGSNVFHSPITKISFERSEERRVGKEC